MSVHVPLKPRDKFGIPRAIPELKDPEKEAPTDLQFLADLADQGKLITTAGTGSGQGARMAEFIIPNGSTFYLLEASASGTPLCLSNIRSYKTVFKDFVFYHNPRDYNTLANNLFRYYKNRKIRRINSSKVKNLVRNWDFPIIKKRLKKLYIEVLKKDKVLLNIKQ